MSQLKLSVLFVVGCSLLGLIGCEPSVPDGRIRVKNDFQDSEYNVLEVSGGGASFTLEPGQAVLLPHRATNLSFSRRYKDYTRYYEVQCPSNLSRGITIKLIDVHLNRIAGGCTTVDAGQR